MVSDEGEFRLRLSYHWLHVVCFKLHNMFIYVVLDYFNALDSVAAGLSSSVVGGN